MGKNGPISAQKMATSQNYKKWLGNFVKTIIRIIHVKFQTFLSILGRVDAFFVIFQKTRFSFNKGNLRDFEGKMSGNGQFFYGHQLMMIFSKSTHQNDVLVQFSDNLSHFWNLEVIFV